MQTIRATRKHFREGSTGGELISALVKVLASMTLITGNANPSSSLFQILGGVPGGAWMLLTVGVVHIGAWTQPDSNLRMRAIRKGCSCIGVAVWCSILVDLIGVGAIGTIIFIVTFLLFVVVAVGRRRYEPD